jgi:hypothetical protein
MADHTDSPGPDDDRTMADKPRKGGLGGFPEAGTIQPAATEAGREDVSDSPTEDPSRPSNPA